MSWLGVLLFIGMVIGLALEYRGFIWFDRAQVERKRGNSSVVFGRSANLLESYGVNHCVLGVILIMIGGTCFRLGWV